MHELPTSPLERATMLQGILIARATGGDADDAAYRLLRNELMGDARLQEFLPAFARTSRDLNQFWGYISQLYGTYKERRAHIWDGFRPLLDHLEGRNSAPSDKDVGDKLASFDSEGVHSIWAKALSRRHSDPDGAVTAAKTLLESVCKGILERQSVPYPDDADLPKLYQFAAESLSLAPSQHTEETFKTILGSCQQVVNRLANMRNKIGDAHGQGSKRVRPAPRHAALAVNLAGAMATFLVESWQARSTKGTP